VRSKPPRRSRDDLVSKVDASTPAEIVDGGEVQKTCGEPPRRKWGVLAGARLHSWHSDRI